jgi:23S rRNA (guanine745-N1)-methyltransferase
VPAPEPAAAPWRCPACGGRLGFLAGERRWACGQGHSFDAAREGYVNLLLSGRRRSRQPGDSAEMVAARRRFLATGAYDPMTAELARVVASYGPATVLDVGCGEGRHTRALTAPLVLGLDVARPAVAAAARVHRQGWYAVASAADIPLDDASVDLALNVFGPVVPAELVRVVRPGGWVLAAHPGPEHLAGVRALVYDQARPHDVKPPLRNSTDRFAPVGTSRVSFPVSVAGAEQLQDLFAMTPYRWHARPGIYDRLTAAARPSFTTTADIQLTLYQRT